MPEDGNGDNGLTRLDRLERVVEALAASQRQLLTSQVIITDNVDKLTGTVDKLVRTVENLAQKVDSHEDRLQVLIDSQLRMDETLSIIRRMIERQQGQ